MKALFIGLGSIGTRHLQNLTALCEKQGIPLQADALRSGSGHAGEEVRYAQRGQVGQKLHGGLSPFSLVPGQPIAT